MANLNEEEIEEIKERFDMYDKKGDGKVEAFQIVDVIRACGINPLSSDVDKLVKDSELTGKRVDLETFCPIYQQIKEMPGQATYADMMEAFKTYDKDNAGIISAAALRQLLINIGDTLTEEAADVIVSQFEDQASGTVNYSNMAKALMAS